MKIIKLLCIALLVSIIIPSCRNENNFPDQEEQKIILLKKIVSEQILKKHSYSLETDAEELPLEVKSVDNVPFWVGNVYEVIHYSSPLELYYFIQVEDSFRQLLIRDKKKLDVFQKHISISNNYTDNDIEKFCSFFLDILFKAYKPEIISSTEDIPGYKKNKNNLMITQLMYKIDHGILEISFFTWNSLNGRVTKYNLSLGDKLFHFDEDIILDQVGDYNPMIE